MLIGEAVLRSNPRYELVLLDRLEPAELELVASDADGQPAPYGLLRPLEEGSIQPLVVSTDTALLFLTLRQAGPCPAYVKRGLGDRTEATLGRLILDGVLEVEGEDGFRSGVVAWASIEPKRERDAGRTARLSEDAIRYGQALISLLDVPPELLAARLYTYGRRPVTPALRRRMPDSNAVAGHLGLASGDTRATLRRAWIENPSSDDDAPWRSWQPRHSRPRDRRTVSFKLYVSPAVEGLPQALGAVASSLADAPGVLGFKIGRSVEALVRPDKMVAYFAGLDDLHEGATRIRELASGCAPHGVPFTAGITDDGLLSWAIDPPHDPTSRSGRASWRTWVTTRLADYLVEARRGRPEAGDAAAEPWRVALARLSLDGVDTRSWVPDPAIFDYAASS
jgi:hypothetical protein